MSDKADESLEKLIIAGIRLAILRWDLRDEEGKDITDEEAKNIAQDTAWACQGEGTCDDTPIPEWQAARQHLGESRCALPEHKCGLFLTHNEHRDYYQKLSDFIEDGDLADDFDSPEAMKRAIDTDEYWVLQWYPDTPIGFIRVAAPTLPELLELALRTSPGLTNR